MVLDEPWFIWCPFPPFTMLRCVVRLRCTTCDRYYWYDRHQQQRSMSGCMMLFKSPLHGWYSALFVSRNLKKCKGFQALFLVCKGIETFKLVKTFPVNMPDVSVLKKLRYLCNSPTPLKLKMIYISNLYNLWVHQMAQTQTDFNDITSENCH